MMILPLLKRNFCSCIKVFLILFAVICLYTTVIIYMYNPELADMLNDYQKALPEMMSAVGMTDIASNLLEWIQIYLYGFIMNVFPMVFAIILGNKLLMRDIDRGSMAGILTSPNSRFSILLTQVVSAILLMFLMLAAVTGVGIASCEMLFPGELDISHYFLLNVGSFLLQLVVLSIVFLCASFCSESKYFYTFGAGIPILFFLIQMISNMGEKLQNLKYLTIYTLFPAQDIIQGTGNAAAGLISMAVLSLLMFSGSMIWFCKRDLSL